MRGKVGFLWSPQGLQPTPRELCHWDALHRADTPRRGRTSGLRTAVPPQLGAGRFPPEQHWARHGIFHEWGSHVSRHAEMPRRTDKHLGMAPGVNCGSQPRRDTRAPWVRRTHPRTQNNKPHLKQPQSPLGALPQDPSWSSSFRSC